MTDRKKREKPTVGFDLEAELASDPPKSRKGTGVALLDHPRMKEWLTRLVELRRSGSPITNRYIAEKLTKGGQAEGILPEGKIITQGYLRWYLTDRGMTR